MSLRGQFFLSVVLALLLGLALETAVAGWHARRSVETEMDKALVAADQIVDNALLSLPQTGQDVYLARLVQSFDGNRHVRVTLTADGRTLSVSRVALADPVPGWFLRLLQVPPQTRQDFSPRLTGQKILVQTDPRNEIGETWGQLRDSGIILALFSLLVLGLLHLVMLHMARPLKKLSTGFDALGGGDYAARVPMQGPRELIYLSGAFNRMAERLGTLESANRRMAGQMLAIQEEERSDLARDLHDEMGPFLFAVQVEAKAIADAGGDEIAGRARAIAEAISHIQNHVRQMLRQLRGPGILDVGLAQATANLAAFWQRHHPGIAIALDIAPDAGSFGADADAALFRLVQEGLTNAARHSRARHVWIRLTGKAGMIRIVLEDDGIGFGDSSEGMGLSGMRERLNALSGRLVLDRRPGGGARLVAEIPRARAAMPMVPA